MNILLAPLTASLLVAGGACYAAVRARTATRHLSQTLGKLHADVCPPVPRSSAGRLAVAEHVLTHVEASLALSHVAEEQDAVQFGVRWAESALDDAELLAIEERDRIEAARARLERLRIKADTQSPPWPRPHGGPGDRRL